MPRSSGSGSRARYTGSLPDTRKHCVGLGDHVAHRKPPSRSVLVASPRQRIDMRIGIVGGGPAGLYFALLMKRRYPSHAIRVVEQNPANATFGFGVVFSDRAMGFLKEADAESYRDIERRLQTWDDQAIVHRDQQVRIDGLGFSGIARLG